MSVKKELLETSKRIVLIDMYIQKQLKTSPVDSITIQQIPTKTKITILTPNPGLLIGGGGETLKTLTSDLVKKFNIQNVVIDIQPVENRSLSAISIANILKRSIEERKNFRNLMNNLMKDAISAGARGIEIILSGKVGGSALAQRRKYYKGIRVYTGNLRKLGVKTAKAAAQTKKGTVGITVKLIPPEAILAGEIKAKILPTEQILITSAKENKQNTAPSETSIVFSEEKQ
ncbi:MAG: hypothetical protein CVU81_01765 [Euryarchaeota archaeon HGW-Euryarchaeota-1]|nr:MAG: hypothetical protein CVU81_01765 [Euryarchaeota archaeon HGW-Euryarchaeota-1]